MILGLNVIFFLDQWNAGMNFRSLFEAIHFEYLGCACNVDNNSFLST